MSKKTFCLVLISFLLGALRLLGEKGNLVKDVDHMWVGFLACGALQGNKASKYLFIILGVVELVSFFILYPTKVSLF